MSIGKKVLRCRGLERKMQIKNKEKVPGSWFWGKKAISRPSIVSGFAGFRILS